MISNLDKKYFKLAVGEHNIKHESSCDIQARCPICGDSKYSKNKARLHLYEKNGVTLVNCFNECSCVNKPVFKFLRDYYPSLLESYNRENFENKMLNIKQKVDFNSSDLIGDLNLDISEKSENSEKISKNTFSIPPILFDLSSHFVKSTKVLDYIESRGLEWFPQFGEIYTSDEALTIDGKFYNLKNFIIIPLYCNDKMYGFYSRSLTEHKFYTYIPDKNSGFKMWNYYNIDPTKTVYVFEGIFDALSAYCSGIDNVIACMGATPPMDKLGSLDLVFCLDNDRTGIINSIKYCKLGYKVVSYSNNFKDVNEMYINNVDVKSEIQNSIVSGILGTVRLQNKL